MMHDESYEAKRHIEYLTKHDPEQNVRSDYFDRFITADNPLCFYSIIPMKEFGNPMYPPDPTGDMKMVVHRNATRGDVTVYMDIGSDANLEHFKSRKSFIVALMTKNGHKMWDGMFHWWNIQRDNRYIGIGHLGSALPNEGEYDLTCLPWFKAKWMMDRHDEAHRWNRRNDPMFISARAWLRHRLRRPADATSVA